MIFRAGIILKLLLLICLSASGNYMYSSPKKLLKISFKKEVPDKIYLSSFYGVKIAKIDSSKVENGGVFSFYLNENIKKGFYRVSVNDTNYIDLILTGDESVEIVANGYSLKKETEVRESIENKALWNLKASRLVYNRHKNDIFYRLQKHKNDPEKFRQAQKSLDSLEKKFNVYASDLLNSHKGTYFYLTNKMILSPLFTDSTLLLNTYKNDTSVFLKENFFINIDFSKEELLNSTLLPNQFMKYLEKHVQYDEKGFMDAVDLILSKAKANPLVYQFSLDFLLQLFDEAGPSIIFEYVVDRYYDKNTCNAGYREKADRFKSLALGNVLPDIDLVDFYSYGNLKDIYVKNKLTLVYFWSSHCSFCVEFTPLLLETYKNYHSSGLEILGISIDENKIEWEKYINENKILWLNYNELKGWNSDVVRKMMVNKTPTFFLVNTNGVIVGKNYNFVEIKEVIKALIEE